MLHERRDASTDPFGILRIFRLDQDAKHRLGARATDENPTVLAELVVRALDLRDHLRRELPLRDADVQQHLRVARHHGGGLAQGATENGPAEKKRRCEPVASHVVPEPDEVARLLTAEHTALAIQRLEHVSVADRRGHDLYAVLRHEPVEAEVRHDSDRDQLDAEAREIVGAIATAPPLAVRAWRQNLLDMSMPLVTKSLHDELSAQMLIYKSDDFAEFKKARAEDRAPVYRTT